MHQVLGCYARGQALAFVTIPHQHEVQRGLTQQGSRVQHRVEGIGQAHRTGVAHHRGAGGARRAKGLRHVVAQHDGGLFPFVERDAVGHDVQLVQVEPA